jgi:hypothetical protein
MVSDTEPVLQGGAFIYAHPLIVPGNMPSPNLHYRVRVKGRKERVHFVTVYAWSWAGTVAKTR